MEDVLVQSPVKDEFCLEDKDRATFEKFMNRGTSPCDYEKQLVENHEDMITAIFEGKIVPPYEVEIQPSSFCNIACKHCFGSSLSNERLPNVIDDSAMEKIISEIDDFRENGFLVETVKFCGTTGEPFVNPSTLYGIDLLEGMEKNVIVFTNGLNLNSYSTDGRQYLDYVLKTDKLNLSLDAGCEETFRALKGRLGFDRIVKSLETMVGKREAVGSGLKIGVSYVIGQYNYGDIVGATKMMKGIGVDEMKFRVDFTDVERIHELSGRIIADLNEAVAYSDDNFVVNSVYSDDEIGCDDSAFSAGGRKCFNQHFWACVGPDAELYACGHRTYKGVTSYGSLLNNSFRDLWTDGRRLENVENLPDNYCKFCSPSSLRRNDFMTFLDGLKKDQFVNSV